MKGYQRCKCLDENGREPAQREMPPRVVQCSRGARQRPRRHIGRERPDGWYRVGVMCAASRLNCQDR